MKQLSSPQPLVAALLYLHPETKFRHLPRQVRELLARLRWRVRQGYMTSKHSAMLGGNYFHRLAAAYSSLTYKPTLHLTNKHTCSAPTISVGNPLHAGFYLVVASAIPKPPFLCWLIPVAAPPDGLAVQVFYSGQWLHLAFAMAVSDDSGALLAESSDNLLDGEDEDSWCNPGIAFLRSNDFPGRAGAARAGGHGHRPLSDKMISKRKTSSRRQRCAVLGTGPCGSLRQPGQEGPCTRQGLEATGQQAHSCCRFLRPQSQDYYVEPAS